MSENTEITAAPEATPAPEATKPSVLERAAKLASGGSAAKPEHVAATKPAPAKGKAKAKGKGKAAPKATAPEPTPAPEKKGRDGLWVCPADCQRSNIPQKDGGRFEVWTVPGTGGPGALIRRVSQGKKGREIQVMLPGEFSKVVKGLGSEFKLDLTKRPSAQLCEALIAAFAPQAKALSMGQASRLARAVLVADVAARPLTAAARKTWAA
jgi:hypothetical protein